MNKYLLLVIVLFIAFSSCTKDSTFDPVKQAKADDAAIQAYIATKNITATKDASGVYYSVITAGTGAYPSSSSTVNVDYEGELLNGSVFSPTSYLSYPLVGLIKGWQIGLPHINTGGTILLIVPSGLAYGNSSPGGGIPSNAVLVFTIKLVSFSN